MSGAHYSARHEGGDHVSAVLKRQCKTCGRTLAIDAFYRKKWGVESNCKECYRDKHNAQRRKKPPRVGKRTLIARTCYRCGCLKLAESFPHRDERGGWQYMCRECAFAQMKERAYDVRAQIVTRAVATRHGRQWTGPELEVALREDLSDKEAALMLGRTHLAVATIRKKLRDGHPMKAIVAGARSAS